MDPSIRMLRAVVAVDRTGHFGAAAAELGIPRSSLSDHVVALERALGEPVFDRRAHPVVATPRGREVIDRALPVVEAHDRLRGWLEAEADPSERTVRLGYLSGLDGARLSAILRAAHQALPGWRIDLEQLGFVAVEDALRADRVDVILAVRPVDLDVTDLRGTEVWREPRVLMVARNHRLATSPEVRLADLAGEPVVAATDGRDPTTRAWVVDPRPDGVPVVYGPHARSLDEAVQLVAAGLGVNVTAASVGHGVSHDRVAFVPIIDAPPASVWVLARSADRSYATTTLEDTIRRVGADRLP